MIVGLMQPYFFPYLGYFELVVISDRWVIFDNVQYKKQSWMTRNRMLHRHQGWQYINIPVHKRPTGTQIKDITVVDPVNAPKGILRQLDHYRRRAPYFDQVKSLIMASFSNARSSSLADINTSTLIETCRYLDLRFKYTICSEMDLELGEIEHAGQWGLRVAERLGAQEYVNAPGGRAIFRPDEWRRAGIRLTFTKLKPFHYDCAPFEHHDHLSILDVLMWNDPLVVRHELLRRKSLPRDGLGVAEQSEAAHPGPT